MGRVRVTWKVDEGDTSKLVTLVTAGPGPGPEPGAVPDAGLMTADTLQYRILRP
jgi:hypothetical protein